MLYNMAKDFVHAIVLPHTHDKAQRAAQHLNVEINQVYEEALTDYAVKNNVPMSPEEDDNAR